MEYSFPGEGPGHHLWASPTAESVRGALLTKEPDSSFAGAHRGILSEPTHIEGEDEDQEDEVEDERL